MPAVPPTLGALGGSRLDLEPAGSLVKGDHESLLNSWFSNQPSYRPKEPPPSGNLGIFGAGAEISIIGTKGLNNAVNNPVGAASRDPWHRAASGGPFSPDVGNFPPGKIRLDRFSFGLYVSNAG
jgi:hypothetical protein